MPSPSSPSPTAPGPRSVRRAAGALILAIVTAYLTSFPGALVFDDIEAIANNPTIRHPGLDMFLIAVGPQGGTLSGRPVPNLTLALNYAVSGSALWSYHAGNLLIHVLAALTLFGLVRRTLNRPPLGGKYGDQALFLGLVIAGLWALHPLQTESVTYLVQRVESLMGLFYLLTLYCFARAADSPRPGRWLVASFLACLTGMGCKEVMVSAPLLVLLYDRTFVAGSWRETWHRRRWFHVSLLSTWLLLAILVIATHNRSGTAGLGTAVSWWEYLLTQCRAIVHYLRLSLWPRPLVFDYGTTVITGLAPVAAQATLLLLLLLGTGWALVRKPPLGFLGAWFFLILAPSSSVVPVATQTMTEHRMYLSLAAVIVLVVLLLQRRLGRAALPIWLALALALGATTARRNIDYHSPLGLWADTARKLPTNARAHNTAGAYLLAAGRIDEARARFLTALRLDPRHANTHYNYGNLLVRTGEPGAAMAEYETALQLDPKLADAHVNLGNLLDQQGRPAAAVIHYEKALQLDPGAPDIHAYLGAALLQLGRPAEARENFQTAVELEPGRAEYWNQLGQAELEQGHLAAARRAVERALQLKPDEPAALYALGNIEASGGEFVAAIDHYRRAVTVAPDYVAARNNLANALLMTGRTDEAIIHYRRILQQQPDDVSVRENLARALAVQGNSR